MALLQSTAYNSLYFEPTKIRQHNSSYFADSFPCERSHQKLQWSIFDENTHSTLDSSNFNETTNHESVRPISSQLSTAEFELANVITISQLVQVLARWHHPEWNCRKLYILFLWHNVTLNYYGNLFYKKKPPKLNKSFRKL